MEEKPNIRHEVVFMAAMAHGEELSALYDEPEDVVERLETFPDLAQCFLAVSVENQVCTVPDTGEKTLQTKSF